MRSLRLLGTLLLSACIVADDGDDDGGDTGDTGDPGSEGGPDTGTAGTTTPGEGGDPTGSPTTTAGNEDPTTAGNEDPSGNPETTDGSGLACGLFNADDMCTLCVIDGCCPQAQACADDELCNECVQLANSGMALEQYELGCFDHSPYTALTDCVNDPSGCGPICNPVATCGEHSCIYDSDCSAVGCTGCGASGFCY